MKLEFRQAKPEDARIAKGLVYSAGSEGFEYVFSHKNKTAIEFIEYAFTNGSGLFGHRVHIAAEHEGRLVGVASFYSGKEYFRLNAAMGKLILMFYGLRNCLQVYRKSYHTLSLLPAPSKDMEYVGDLGVVEEMRGRGVGTALLNYGLELAKKKGMRRYVIDVSVDNPRARQLYERFGFKITGLNKFRGPAGSIHVPDSRRMELFL